MPRPKIPVEDRLEIISHFVMTPLGEREMRVKAYSSILQHNLDYRRNFVFGLISWDNVCTKASGERARTDAPTGAII